MSPPRGRGSVFFNARVSAKRIQFQGQKKSNISLPLFHSALQKQGIVQSGYTEFLDLSKRERPQAHLDSKKTEAKGKLPPIPIQKKSQAGMPPTAPKPKAVGMPSAAPKPKAVGMPSAAPKPKAVGMPPAAPKPKAVGMPPTAPKPKAVGMPPTASKPKAVGMPSAAPKPKAVGISLAAPKPIAAGIAKLKAYGVSLPSLASSPSIVLEDINIDSSVDRTVLRVIQNSIDSPDYLIPARWPQYSEQRGHCCGLYALATGLKYSNPNRVTPNARKDGKKGEVSLRQRAKEYKFTSFGEIFDVRSFSKLADSFGFKNCVSVVNKYKSLYEYVNTICYLLKKGGCVIAACDLGNDRLPGNAGGLETHWGLIYGYYFSNDECQFLTYQYGKTFIWPAEKLFQSNQQLPIVNPRRNYFNYKNKETHVNLLKKETSANTYFNPKRYVIGDTLQNFSSSLCYIPAQETFKLMKFEDKILENLVMRFSPR